MQSETGAAYTGGAYVTTSGRICRLWSSSSWPKCQVCGDFLIHLVSKLLVRSIYPTEAVYHCRKLSYVKL